MKAVKIYYKELRTFGQFNNREVGIELEVGEGEKAQEVLAKAKLFVQAALSGDALSPALLESVVRSVKNAQIVIDDFAKRAQDSLPLDDEIPF